MERQSGLGRSLGDVLDSLTPVDPDPAAPGRVLFEPEDLEQQLDSLMGDIRELRERVQHLVALVPEVGPEAEQGEKKPKKKSKKKHKKHKAKKHKHRSSKAHARAA
jgi:hypothetical protein